MDLLLFLINCLNFFSLLIYSMTNIDRYSPHKRKLFGPSVIFKSVKRLWVLKVWELLQHITNSPMIGLGKELRKAVHGGLEDSVKTSRRNRNLHWVLNDRGGFGHCRMEMALKSGRQKEETQAQNTECVGVEESGQFGCNRKASSGKVLRKVTRDR